MKITRTTPGMLAVVASIVVTGSASAHDLGPQSDYRSDARANPLMTLGAKRLTKTELAGVAVYFVRSREQNALGPQESHNDVYRQIGHISVRLSDDQMMRLGFIYQGAL
jgi:hypothetical protein